MVLSVFNQLDQQYDSSKYFASFWPHFLRKTNPVFVASLTSVVLLLDLSELLQYSSFYS